MTAQQDRNLLLRFRDTDSDLGVTRHTVKKLAKALSLSETQAIHYALAQMARAKLPAYAPDNGALTEAQIQVLQELAPQGRMKTTASLLG